MTSSLGGYVTAVLVRKTVKLVCSEGMQADAGRKEGFCYEVGSTGPTGSNPFGTNTNAKVEMKVYKNDSVPPSPSNAFVPDSSAPQAPSVADAAPAPVLNAPPAAAAHKTENIPEVRSSTPKAAKESEPEFLPVPVLEEAAPAEQPEAVASPQAESSPKAATEAGTPAGDADDEPVTPTTVAPEQPPPIDDLLDLGLEGN